MGLCDSISPNECQRWVIQDGNSEEVYSSDKVNMGDEEALADFLQWGILQYPSAGMGLILWDHGSDSINGLCFDELYDNDSLLLKEIDAALYSVYDDMSAYIIVYLILIRLYSGYDDMSAPFSFTGFDACLMATLSVIDLSKMDDLIEAFDTYAKALYNLTENDGDYLYAFCINDIYGNYYMTDPLSLSVSGEDIYFDDLS
jgi:hypothetical protein